LKANLNKLLTGEFIVGYPIVATYHFNALAEDTKQANLGGKTVEEEIIPTVRFENRVILVLSSETHLR